MYGFIVGKKTSRRMFFRIILGVFVGIVLSFFSLLGSIGSKRFLVSAETSDLVINEVFCNPEKDSDEEWVEICNNSGSSIDLSGFKIGDEETKGGGEGMYEFPGGSSICSHCFHVIALKSSGYEALYSKKPDFEIFDTDFTVPNLSKYSSWASGQIAFNNSGDEALLLDENDSIVNQADFGTCTAGHSFERIPFGTGDFEDRSEPTPGIGVESSESEGGTDGDADGEAGLAVSFSAPSAVNLGEEFEVEISLENAISGRSYLVKFGANDGSLEYGQFSKGYTWSDSKGKFIPFSGGGYSWSDFPSVNSEGGIVKARITTSALAGDCATMVRVRDMEEEDNHDSEVKMIRTNEALEEVEEEEEEKEDESDDSENGSGEVLGEQDVDEESPYLEVYGFGPSGKDSPQATISPILSASSTADEATPSTEAGFLDLIIPSKSSVFSKILLALGGLVILGALGFSIAKKRGLV